MGNDGFAHVLFDTFQIELKHEVVEMIIILSHCIHHIHVRWIRSCTMVESGNQKVRILDVDHM